MTQDCLNSPSTADVSKRLPKGIHVTGADDKSDPAIEGMPWGDLFFHNKTAQTFEKEMKDYNDKLPSVASKKKTLKPSRSNLPIRYRTFANGEFKEFREVQSICLIK